MILTKVQLAALRASEDRKVAAVLARTAALIAFNRSQRFQK